MSDYPQRGIAQEGISKKSRGPIRQDWLLTYSDIITLLFTFVLIILKVSDVNENRFDELREGLSQTFLKQDVSTAFQTLSEEVKTLKDRFNEIQVSSTNKVIEITFADSSFYDIGSASITDDGLFKIEKLLAILDNGPYKRFSIEIEGHTDDVPISNKKFASNWELSTARATNIVKELESLGIPSDRIRAVGYSASQPIIESLDENGDINPSKRGLNRRIVIKISRFE